MSIGTILNNLLIYPLQLFFEMLYGVAYRLIGNYGISIIVLSLAVNFIVLPLYRRADAMQQEERDMEQKLAPWVKHIRKTFKGDERYMMLQAYYKQNNYSSFYALRGSVSLILQIPFFMAAYRFLSGYEHIRGVSFGPITDLGSPDGLLKIAGLTLNILPILMTLINIVSGAIYTRGMSLKSKIQLYAMALIFLFFLYRAPAGLAFYWTLNNLFSLIKNIFYKLKNPGKVLGILSSLAGILLFIAAFIVHTPATGKRKLFVILVCLALQLPFFLLRKKRTRAEISDPAAEKSNLRLFFGAGLVLAVLIGVLIPSSIIADSPLEFVSPRTPANPLSIVANSALIGAGLFLVWFGVFYWLSEKRSRRIFAFCVWTGAILCIVDYMAFGSGLGNISSQLKFDVEPVFARKDQLINLAVLLAIALGAFIIWKKVRKAAGVICLALLAGVCILSVQNLAKAGRTYRNYISREDAVAEQLQIPLTKTGKNVVVIMLDRAINAYIPYIMQEKPWIRDQFAGFTYYPDTLSFGTTTNFASAALFGGYEYTPEELNKRSDESLETKQNEALKVMPDLFTGEGFEVTVSDPPYAGYSWIPDLSIFDDYPEMHTYNSDGYFTETLPVSARTTKYVRKRNFFCYGIFKSVPLVLQHMLYDEGNYLGNKNGILGSFCDAYSVLTSLPQITEVRDGGQDTFFMIANDTTHEPCHLQKPDYEPANEVSNYDYDDAVTYQLEVDGKKLNQDTDNQRTHYDINVAAMIKLGEWFDYLRENGVYDNTRIILVADHGRDVSPTDDAILPGKYKGKSLDMTYFHPLLMVKDFDAQEFTTDDSLMTNADVPLLAMDGLVQDPVNPFTGNALTDDAKKDPAKRHLVRSGNWEIDKNNGNVLDSSGGQWYEIEGEDIFDPDNWLEIEEPLQK